jgi:hypothetical protein
VKGDPLPPRVLPASASPWVTGAGQSEAALIQAEIASRILEMSELISRDRVVHWLSSLCTLAADRESREAFWLYLRIATGDLGELTRSYESKGESRCCTKQGEQQEHERAMAVIRKHLPAVGEAIRQLELKTGAAHK